ncbi:MAG TPA: MotA/TolQ/ExbB proton channel family protein [Thermodesulfobacteriota bacterium]|nr:MotA/TolQ/ExbB proton channel family protein [Thermodesulfobacteriota bacterium]
METLVSFFRDGGIFMYFILIVSIVGFAIMVERGILLIHKYNVDGRALWKKVSKFLYEGNIEQARALCSDLRVPLMRILHHGIAASAKGSVEDVQTAIDEIALEIIPTIDKRVAYLAALANIATLLGLLGTIQGLIQAFAAIAHADPSQKATLLASGIAIALYTTAFGLIVAIPMLLMYTVLQAKAQKIIDEIDEFAVKLINFLKEGKGGVSAK